MMNRLISYFRQPYEADNHPLFSTILAMVIVAFVLLVFQPFGLSGLQTIDFVYTIAASVAGTGAGMLVSLYLLPKLFEKYYSDRTLGKYILGNIVTVFIVAIFNASAISVYALARWNTVPDFYALFIITLLVSPVIVTILALLSYNRRLSAHLQEAQKMNGQLLKNAQWGKKTGTVETVTLSGVTKESLTLDVEKLVFVEAFGNYVKVNYLQDDALKQKLLRATIKQIEDALHGYSSVIRCHRAFLVNASRISSVKGNSQGYKLSFLYAADEIPVSRAYARRLKELLEQSF